MTLLLGGGCVATGDLDPALLEDEAAASEDGLHFVALPTPSEPELPECWWDEDQCEELGSCGSAVTQARFGSQFAFRKKGARSARRSGSGRSGASSSAITDLTAGRRCIPNFSVGCPQCELNFTARLDFGVLNPNFVIEDRVAIANGFGEWRIADFEDLTSRGSIRLNQGAFVDSSDGTENPVDFSETVYVRFTLQSGGIVPEYSWRKCEPGLPCVRAEFPSPE